MSVDVEVVLCILESSCVLFASGRVPHEVVAILVLDSLTASGIVEPGEALACFSSPAAVAFGTLPVISGGLVRRGAIRWGSTNSRRWQAGAAEVVSSYPAPFDSESAS